MKSNLSYASQYFFSELLNISKYTKHSIKLLAEDLNNTIQYNGAFRTGISLQNAISLHLKFLKDQGLSVEEEEKYLKLVENPSIKEIFDKIKYERSEPDFFKFIQDDNLVRIMVTTIDLKNEYERESEYILTNSIVNLTTIIEQLISETIKFLIITNPKSVSIEKKQVTFEKIQELGDIEAIQEYIINKKVSELMFEKNNKWFDFISNNFKIDFSKIEDIYFFEVNELIQRRHIIIHNASTIDEKYINNISDYKDEKIFIGQKIENSPKYVFDKLKNITIFSIKFLDVILNKYEEKNVNFLYSIEKLSRFYYVNEDFVTAEQILEIVFKEKYLSEVHSDDREDITIQYWSAKRMLNKIEKTDNDIKNYKPVKLKNKIYKFLILENYSELEELLTSLIKKEVSFFYELEKNPLLRLVCEESENVQAFLIKIAKKTKKSFNHEGYIYKKYISNNE